MADRGSFGGGPAEMPPEVQQSSADWTVPSWVMEQQPGLLQLMQGGGGGAGFNGIGGGGGAPLVFGNQPGNVAPYLNPANWGPPPALDEATDPGWFPNEFKDRSNPNEKFWSQKDYLRQRYNKYGGQMPEVADERPNTRNWRMLGGIGLGPQGLGLPGGVPGDFMYLGHHINQTRLGEDFRQGTDPSGEGGVNRPPIRRVTTLGPEFPGIFNTGGGNRVGLPGQLEPWMAALDPPK